MKDMNIIPGTPEMVPEILALYRAVAGDPAGLIRRPEEITEAYVNDFVTAALANGLILVITTQGRIVGEIHAYTPPLAAFSHILTELTIVMAPAYQGMGFGKKLFAAFLARVAADHPHILRVELFVRETNTRNVALYQLLGFQVEGRHVDKIRLADAAFETPLQMTWFNPGYRKRHG